MINYGGSVLLATLTATFCQLLFEWEISKLAVSLKFSNGVTVPVVFHSEGWSTKAVIVSVVLGGTVRVPSVKTNWGFPVISLAAVLTWIGKCGKSIRPCVVSMTRLLCLMKCNPTIGPVKLSITTKCLAKVVSRISNLSVIVANKFSNCPFPSFSSEPVSLFCLVFSG